MDYFVLCDLVGEFRPDDRIRTIAQFDEFIHRQLLLLTADRHFGQIAARDIVAVMQASVGVEQPVDRMEFATDDTQEKRRPMRRANIDDTTFS